MVDGCKQHRVSATAVEKRWSSLEALIDGAPEADRDAQWSVVLYCACCLGPAKYPAELCTRCEVVNA